MTDATAFYQKALDAFNAGNIAGAVDACRAAIAEDPKDFHALSLMGVIAMQQGNATLALQLTEAALAANPNHALSWYNRALTLRQLERREEAMQSVTEALRLDPRYAEAWSLQGFLQQDAGQRERALAGFTQALALKPSEAKFHADLAYALMLTGDLAEAYASMRRTHAIDPACQPLIMANILKNAGHTGKAIPFFEAARKSLPPIEAASAAVNEAMARLQIGDFAAGWRLWETRRFATDPYPDLPYWDGALTDHLLLYEDQGFGDALQGARFIPQIAKRAKRVTLIAPKALQALFKASFPAITMTNTPPADATAKARLFSLPALCEARLDNLPQPPYLALHDEWRAPWRDRLATVKQPRIGLVYAGNPQHRNDYKRSVPVDLLQPLLENARGHLVSLQLGHALPVGCMDATPYLTDFTATAGLLAELDLLITVDTSVAHLAGALNIPCWLLLPTDPDWRWLLGRADSPWYPSLKLYRQTQIGDWAGVIAHVTEDARRFLNGDASVLSPSRWTGPVLQTDPHAVDLA